MHILILYNATQTYTETVLEHLDAFSKYSRHEISYHHLAPGDRLSIDFNVFDSVVVHYTIRLPYDQLSSAAANSLADYDGMKLLFIQDEYDHTNRAKHWIKHLKFDLVFTVVPERSINKVYPKSEFSHTRFVTNLTGYVPHKIDTQFENLCPPSQRKLIIGYRGRPLPIRYGQLGIEKIAIGKNVKSYCKSHGLPCDIEWGEENRIYGERWYTFISSCRGMLGTESGSNVFDWNGTLGDEVTAYRKLHPFARSETVYHKVISRYEIPGLMNQASPRIFEMIAAGTAMVLFEGEYSGVIQPDRHYIPLKKDFSNLDAAFEKLLDDSWIDAMTTRARLEILEPGKYSYAEFITKFDTELDSLHGHSRKSTLSIRSHSQKKGFGTNDNEDRTFVTKRPLKSQPPLPSMLPPLIAKVIIIGWSKLPVTVRKLIKKVLGKT